MVAPAGMHRLQAMLESAWNLTEPYRPMALVPAAERAELHAEHEWMLAAFVARDAAALLDRAARHHEHLRRAIGSLFSHPGGQPDRSDQREPPCTSS
ncbi:hypothetical protein BJF78_29600 [Pseudonocardia sp. CNS-139]|nr:hypothetical protein BJF78_29600 [Pseudonocardia sp. CNS-139]